MERIQSAIKKARETRETQEAKAAQPVGEQVVPLPNGESDIYQPETSAGDAWNSLPAYKPNLRHLNRSRIVTTQSSTAATPFDSIRTKLLYKMRANNWRRVAITSTGTGCGKTVVCLNLAFSLARQSDIKTIAMELDLRNPSMSSILRLKEKHQISDVLEQSADARNHMVRYHKNLAIATNHGTVENPAELLQGSSTAPAIDRIEEQFSPDIVMFDTPPMLVYDDTLAFLNQVDCALLIASAEKTTLEEIEKCEQDIASRTEFLGVVLNKCRYLGGVDL